MNKIQELNMKMNYMEKLSNLQVYKYLKHGLLVNEQYNHYEGDEYCDSTDGEFKRYERLASGGVKLKYEIKGYDTNGKLQKHLKDNLFIDALIIYQIQNNIYSVDAIYDIEERKDFHTGGRLDKVDIKAMYESGKV